jgi:hypothetical protein
MFYTPRQAPEQARRNLVNDCAPDEASTVPGVRHHRPGEGIGSAALISTHRRDNWLSVDSLENIRRAWLRQKFCTGSNTN